MVLTEGLPGAILLDDHSNFKSLVIIPNGIRGQGLVLSLSRCSGSVEISPSELSNSLCLLSDISHETPYTSIYI